MGATPFFADQLERFGDALALVDRGGNPVPYNALLTRVDRFSDSLGTTRRLVFVEAAHTVDSVAAYIACLRGRHPVHLFNNHGRQQLSGLVDRYRPNVIVPAGTDRSEPEWLHHDMLDLHADLCVLASTSGSTGSPKFVKLSRRNLDSNARSIASYLALDASERAVTTLPFNYALGMSVVNSHLACGGALVLTDDSVTEPAFWRTFRGAGATSFTGVPYTFELIHQAQNALGDLRTLRYAAQAGGRLEPGLVRHFAGLAALQGWRFFVMYGQTEAAPRMAYLPPDRALTHPHCIGVPVPGGHIAIVDDQGADLTSIETPGQLAYSGPNVMMGYAERLSDLATDETPLRLLTGDVACRDAQGLFYITGRTSRFVKPFGLRINLDDVESKLKTTVPDARCAGDDQRIVVAVGADQVDAGVAAAQELAKALNLPGALFTVVGLTEIPRLAGGKVDYAGILAAVPGTTRRAEVPSAGAAHALRLIFSKRFVRQFATEVLDQLGMGRTGWRSVAQIYETLLATPSAGDLDTFKSLAGDSLSYVQVTAALTDYLGALPANWSELSIRDLESMKLSRHVAGL